MTLTTERSEFLRDIQEAGISFASYWCSVESWDGDTAVLREHEGGATHTVTLDTIAEGINKLSTEDVNYRNLGYRKSSYGDTQPRIALFNRTNGLDSDTDSLDYDAMLQVGIFGEVIYG